MKNVWIVTDFDQEPWQVCGVFSSKEEAEKLCKKKGMGTVKFEVDKDYTDIFEGYEETWPLG